MLTPKDKAPPVYPHSRLANEKFRNPRTDRPGRVPARRLRRHRPFNMLGRRNTLAPTTVSTTPVTVPAGPGLAAAERERAFDFVWGTINDRYYDPNLNGVDWKAAARNSAPSRSAPPTTTPSGTRSTA
jgi:hypothetical protein